MRRECVVGSRNRTTWDANDAWAARTYAIIHYTFSVHSQKVMLITAMQFYAI
jgi:hypothetical protein